MTAPCAPLLDRDDRLAVPTAEAARLLGLSVRTLQNWRCEGVGPHYTRVSDRVTLYAIADLRNFVSGDQ